MLAYGATDTRELAYSSTWLKLLHYEPSRLKSGSWQSAIHSGDFFLSPRGRTDPQAELEALIGALATNEIIGDEHPRCRFPARSRWLDAQLGRVATVLSEIACPRFSAWAKQGNVVSISLVFATGYLGNPASYYGHTLLKFNEEAGELGQSGLLDLTVNYGAIIEGAADPVSYIVKGVAGGYDGGFSHVDFYFHNHNYGENELRDLWEYRLELPQPAVDLIVAHAWEVLGKRYTYYFFRRNCAYRMAEILEVVEGIDILPPDRPWTIPQSLIQNTAQARYDGHPLVRSVHYHPSRQSRFYARFESLSPAEQVLLSDVVLGRQQLSETVVSELPEESRQRLLDTLLDYSRYFELSNDPDSQQASPLYLKALQARLRLPAGGQDVTVEPNAAPHDGRPPGWAQLAWADNNRLGGSLMLRIRPAYYDPLDTGSYHVANTALSMGDLEISIRHGRARLHKLDVIKIESAQAGISGLPGDRGEAWKLRIGVEQASAACLDCRTARMQGDYGFGRRWPAGLFTALYIGGALQEGTDEMGWGFARISGDAIVRWTPAMSAKLSLEQRHGLGGQRANLQVTRAEMRWALGHSSDVRIGYESDVAYTGYLGLGFYW